MAYVIFFFSDKPNEAMYKKICWKIIQKEKKYLVQMNVQSLGASNAIMKRENPWIININLWLSIYIFCKYYAVSVTP